MKNIKVKRGELFRSVGGGAGSINPIPPPKKVVVYDFNKKTPAFPRVPPPLFSILEVSFSITTVMRAFAFSSFLAR